jgi:hypothetical protein
MSLALYPSRGRSDELLGRSQWQLFLWPFPVLHTTYEIVVGRTFVSFNKGLDAMVTQNGQCLMHPDLHLVLKHACENFAIFWRQTGQEQIDLVLIRDELRRRILIPQPSASTIWPNLTLDVLTHVDKSIDHVPIHLRL